MNITYVTGNKGKYYSVKKHFEKFGIIIDYANIDFEEPNINDIREISLFKAKKAYSILKKPVFVADSGFYIGAYPLMPGYPGAFVKRSGVAKDIDKLLETMKGIKNRNCHFLDCLTYYDGKTIKRFYGLSEGTLAESIKGDEKKEAKSNLWKVFIPKNCTKTLAQMSQEEFENRLDGHTSATEEFIKWLIDSKKYKSNQTDINFDLLKGRVINTLASTDLEYIRYKLSELNEPTLVSGVGGSSVISDFASYILNLKNNIITRSVQPRDFNYLNLNGYKNVLVCSYTGNNYGVDLAFKNNLKKYLLSSKKRDDVINLFYNIGCDKEYSFISLSATLIPVSILLDYYLDGVNISDYLEDDYSFSFDSNCDAYEIFSGVETSFISKYLESTMIEAGIGIPIVHDKYDFCHGRSTTSVSNQNICIYLNTNTEIDKLLLEELPKYYKEMIVINLVDKHIVGYYKMLIEAMYLFGLETEQVDALISPGSFVHGLVEFKVIFFIGFCK